MSSIFEYRGHTNTAIVVDHEPAVRSTVKSILAEVGFDVVESDNGRHALSFLQTNPCFDLLVTETQPPEVDGRKLAESFMLKCPLGRTVLLSEQVDTAEVSIESTGAWIVIPKRRLSDEFIDAIRSIGLGHPQRVILVVDDEPTVRRLVRVILVKAGYVVIEASGGQEALELSRAYQKSIDLAISDIRMPSMSGPEFVEHFRLERPKTHILLMSGHASGALRDYATSPNFLMKPFAPNQLTDKVAELLNRRESSAVIAEL